MPKTGVQEWAGTSIGKKKKLKRSFTVTEKVIYKLGFLNGKNSIRQMVPRAVILNPERKKP